MTKSNELSTFQNQFQIYGNTWFKLDESQCSSGLSQLVIIIQNKLTKIVFFPHILLEQEDTQQKVDLLSKLLWSPCPQY